jgi:hypothetical protein
MVASRRLMDVFLATQPIDASNFGNKLSDHCVGRDARDSCTQDSCELSSADKDRLRDKQPAGDAGSGEMFFCPFLSVPSCLSIDSRGKSRKQDWPL